MILISLNLLGRVGKGQECCKGEHHRSGMWREKVLRQKLRNMACVVVLVPLQPNPAYFIINV